jgi:nicotinamide phosphoribosyltransferase
MTATAQREYYEGELDNESEITNCDFYKISHREQYPDKTELVYSTWTPRMSRRDGVDKVVVFGHLAFVKEFLLSRFNRNFFDRPKDEVVYEYQEEIYFTLFNPGNAQGLDDFAIELDIKRVPADHIAELHDLGFLPVRIKSLKEGTRVPIKVPILTIENTIGKFFWVTNYLETLMSAEIWMPTTSATIADKFNEIFTEYAMLTVGNADGVKFQGHDFSMRGMANLWAARASGAGHLLSFYGTDTIPAVKFLKRYYGANWRKMIVGTSIPASEHSVMMANGTDELEVIKEFITVKYPSGFLSIVSDTWDFWNVVLNVYGKLKDVIMGRDGRVVIRPDSGDPFLIICGDPNAETEWERKGLVEVLWEIFGGTITEKGYKLLDTHIGCIYGDSITLDVAQRICQRLMEKGFASTNWVGGLGSYTYQYNTRDTFGFALKSTYAIINGLEQKMMKDPKTDVGSFKKSQKGKVVVVENEGVISYIDNLGAEDYAKYADVDLLEDLFVDGKLVRNETLEEIRARLAG